MNLNEQSLEELPISELLAEKKKKKPHGNLINNNLSSPQTCAWLYRVLRFAVSEWTNWKVKTPDDIDARNIITSLYGSLIAFYKEDYSYLRGTWVGSEHRKTAPKKINEHRITARKVNETPLPQHLLRSFTLKIILFHKINTLQRFFIAHM